jgi:acyl carrier protein
MVDEKQILTELTEILRDVFMRDDLVVSPATTADDVPGWDSFKQIEIILAVEGHYCIRLHTRDLDQLGSLGALVRAVKAKLSR